MLEKSEIKKGVILCWGLDHPIMKFWKDYWSVLEVGDLSFKIEMLNGPDEVKEIYFDSEFFSRMEISSPEEAYLHFIKEERRLIKEKLAKKQESDECEMKYTKFHEKVMEFKRKYNPHPAPQLA